MDTEQEQKTAVIYVRVSSKDQVDGTSLEMQERLCREYVERNGWEVLKVFIEEGESAKTANRTEFNKSLIFIGNRKNKVGYFIVYKLDRFARNQEDHITVKAILKKYGTKLRSVTEPIDETLVGKMTEGILSVIAEFDNGLRAERSKGGMEEKVKKGIWVWPEPLGYYRPVKGGNISPEPDRAPLIRLGFEEWSKGTYTYKSLAKFLGDRGLRTRNGKQPCSQLMAKMISNPIYCGIIKSWGGHEGKFEPIVPKELFYKCQEGYEQSVHIAPRQANNPLFPLRGTICESCSEAITGSSSTGRKGKKYPYYHHAHQRCQNYHSIPKETFEQLFVEYLNEITPSGKYEKLFKAVVVDIWKSNYQKYYSEADRTRKEVDALEQERLKIFDYHRSGKYTDEEFEEQKKIINQSIYQKRQLMQEQAVEEFNMEEALDYCFKFVRTTAKTWIELDFQSKLRFQKLVCKKEITFDGKKFGTNELSQVYKLNQEYDGKKSNLVALRGIEPRFSG